MAMEWRDCGCRNWDGHAAMRNLAASVALFSQGILLQNQHWTAVRSRWGFLARLGDKTVAGFWGHPTTCWQWAPPHPDHISGPPVCLWVARLSLFSGDSWPRSHTKLWCGVRLRSSPSSDWRVQQAGSHRCRALSTLLTSQCMHHPHE